MSRARAGLGRHGRDVPGPPWILGRRGAPLEAPENTLSSFRLAIDVGLDGCAYEVRACLGSDLVVLADERLERTTDGTGPVAAHGLAELFRLDAGGWFGAAFEGESLPVFEEVLSLDGNQAGSYPQHLVVLPEPGLAGPVATALLAHGRRLSVRAATPSRDVARELRDLGLAPLLRTERPDGDLRSFVRDERIAAVGASLSAWRAAGPGPWPSERWALDVDHPGDLFEAMRAGFNALTTSHPRRALAVRALCAWAPGLERFPLTAPDLPVDAALPLATGGAWCGRWSRIATVHNPFSFPVRVWLDSRVGRGAFEFEGLPSERELGPGERTEVPFEVAGGSWSPGGDPILVASYRWARGPGRPAGGIALDAPMVRTREAVAGARARRLTFLPEHPGDADASATVRLSGGDLLVALENAGGLQEPELLVHLDGRRVRGGQGLRLALPEGWDRGREGLSFAVGIEGYQGGRLRVRRWCGGVPFEGDSGEPGRLRRLE